jgi:hypothetical protein
MTHAAYMMTLWVHRWYLISWRGMFSLECRFATLSNHSLLWRTLMYLIIGKTYGYEVWEKCFLLKSSGNHIYFSKVVYWNENKGFHVIIMLLFYFRVLFLFQKVFSNPKSKSVTLFSIFLPIFKSPL